MTLSVQVDRAQLYQHKQSDLVYLCHQQHEHSVLWFMFVTIAQGRREALES
jgi:hypothetical protein